MFLIFLLVRELLPPNVGPATNPPAHQILPHRILAFTLISISGVCHHVDLHDLYHGVCDQEGAELICTGIRPYVEANVDRIRGSEVPLMQHVISDGQSWPWPFHLCRSLPAMSKLNSLVTDLLSKDHAIVSMETEAHNGMGKVLGH